MRSDHFISLNYSLDLIFLKVRVQLPLQPGLPNSLEIREHELEANQPGHCPLRHFPFIDHGQLGDEDPGTNPSDPSEAHSRRFIADHLVDELVVWVGQPLREYESLQFVLDRVDVLDQLREGLVLGVHYI